MVEREAGRRMLMMRIGDCGGGGGAGLGMERVEEEVPDEDVLASEEED